MLELGRRTLAKLTITTQNVVETKKQLFEFLDAVLPDNIPQAGGTGTQTRDALQADVAGGIRWSAMSVRLM